MGCVVCVSVCVYVRVIEKFNANVCRKKVLFVKPIIIIIHDYFTKSPSKIKACLPSFKTPFLGSDSRAMGYLFQLHFQFLFRRLLNCNNIGFFKGHSYYIK